MDVLGRINETRDNGAGGPLLRIFFKKRKFKLRAISYLYKIRVGLFEASKCRFFCKRFLLNLRDFNILRQVHVI